MRIEGSKSATNSPGARPQTGAPDASDRHFAVVAAFRLICSELQAFNSLNTHSSLFAFLI